VTGGDSTLLSRTAFCAPPNADQATADFIRIIVTTDVTGDITPGTSLTRCPWITIVGNESLTASGRFVAWLERSAWRSPARPPCGSPSGSPREVPVARRASYGR